MKGVKSAVLLSILLMLSILPAALAAAPPQKKADLVISSISFSPQNPNDLSSVVANVTVSNIGTSKADSFQVSITARGATSTYPIVSLTNGKQSSVSINLGVLPAGTFPITATADYTNVVSELSEANNFLTRQLNVTSTNGSVQVSSIPSGALVLVDGAIRGVTPVTVSGLSPGAHSVVVQLFGYNDVSTSVTVVAGQTQSVFASMTQVQITGSISLSSSPSGANIFIDGLNVGITPMTLQGVQPGNHSVRLALSGYNDYNAAISVIAGQTTFISATLAQVQLTGDISVSSTPSGANVYIDGVYVGISPLVSTGVAQGAHSVRISLSGYMDSNIPVNIALGGVAYVSQVLQPLSNPTNVSVSSSPSGANIYFDGLQVGVTPMVYSTTEGQHQVTLAKTGYVDNSSYVYINQGSNSFFAFLASNSTQVPVAPVLSLTSIKLRPGSSGNQIFVDVTVQNSGSQASAVSTLNVKDGGWDGSYNVNSWSAQVQSIGPGQSQVVSVPAVIGNGQHTLVATLGSSEVRRLIAGYGNSNTVIEINSNVDEAKVYVDFIYMGPTPTSVYGFGPGSHSIILSKEGYDPLEGAVVLEDQLSTSYAANMQSHVSSPSDAPDLVMIDLHVEGTPVVASSTSTTTINFKYGIRNIGTARSPASSYHATFDGISDAPGGYYIQTLAPGEIAYYGVDQRTAGLGTHTLSWVVDHQNLVTESNEQNNQAEVTANVEIAGTPDLQIVSITPFNQVVPMGNITHLFTIKNAGVSTSPATTLSIDAGTSYNYTPYILSLHVNVPVQSLAAGEQIVVPFTYYYDRGVYVTDAAVDRAGLIAEPNENNNIFRWSWNAAAQTANASAVTVTTVPSGAQVYVNGVPKGSSPVTLQGLYQGVHEVRAVLSGYGTYVGQFTADSSVKTVQLVMPPVPGPQSEKQIGTTTLGGMRGTFVMNFWSNKVTLPEQGTVKSITAFLFSDSGTNVAKAALYTDSAGKPYSLIALGPEKSFSTDGQWVTFELNQTTLAPGTYWIGILGQRVGVYTYYMDSTSGITAYRDGTPWPGSLNPMTNAYNGNHKISIYMNYSTGSSGITGSAVRTLKRNCFTVCQADVSNRCRQACI